MSLLLDSIRLEILQLRADSTAPQGGSEVIEEDDAAGQVDTSSFPLDAELLLAASHEEEKRVGATAVQARKEKKAKKKSKGEDGDGERQREGPEGGAESSLDRARRLLGITDRSSASRNLLHDGHSRTKVKPRRRKGRTMDHDHDHGRGDLSALIPRPSDLGDSDSDDQFVHDEDIPAIGSSTGRAQVCLHPSLIHHGRFLSALPSLCCAVVCLSVLHRCVPLAPAGCDSREQRRRQR